MHLFNHCNAPMTAPESDFAKYAQKKMPFANAHKVKR